MRLIQCEQGSPEWFAARLGKVSASHLSDVMAKSKDRKGEGTTRINYKAQLVAEILSGVSCEKAFSSKAMDDGTAREPFARAAYEVATGVMVDKVGFALHDSIERYGASPDGLVGEDGGVEIKCGIPATHLKWLLAGKVPTEHEPQMVGGMSCCNRLWWDFISFCDAFPAPHDLFVVRLYRDEKRIEEIENEVRQFNAEVDEIITKLRAIK